MTRADFIISLDFEMFWGVADSRGIDGYGRNVLGEWEAVPRMLALFRRHGLRVTWATVGMLMCRDYAQWRSIRPALLPGYLRRDISPYDKSELVRNNARLFFARPLVEQILATDGQEMATHTYSHFYCKEAGATPEQFGADLACARVLAADMGVQCRSLVFPRNQVDPDFLPVLAQAGIQAYRGNTQHWLYRNGDHVAGGIAGRAARFADACLPLSGPCTVRRQEVGALINLPASLFLYPWVPLQRALAPIRLQRIKRGMTATARSGGMFHLWWHPHNFGLNLEQNLAMLEDILRHYRFLADRYGMHNPHMADLAAPVEVRQRRPQ